MSSFSVTAASFVPPSMPQQQPPLATSAAGWTVAASGSHHGGQQGTRRVVCSSFFQAGFCADGDFCSFAHHMEELEPLAKAQLIGLMADSLPAHFVGSRAVTGGHAAAAGGAGFTVAAPESLSGRTTPSSFTPYGNPQQQQQQAQAGGGQRWRPAGTFEDECPVRVRLPARCRYPHHVPGTYYDHLNVKRNASPEAIEEAYRTWRSVGYKTAKALDHIKADAMDRLVVDAKNVLSNAIMRREYDGQLPTQTTPINSPIKPGVRMTGSAAAQPTVMLSLGGGLSAAGEGAAATSGRSTPSQQHAISHQALNPALFDDIWTK